MDKSAFRKELLKVMPGYKWTIHKNSIDPLVYLCATGIQSSGLNRISTLQIEMRNREGVISYIAKSSGFGAKAKWLGENVDTTLARALRGLQNRYRSLAAEYGAAKLALEMARRV